MKKPTFWCAYNASNEPIIGSLNHTKKEAAGYVFDLFGEGCSWETYNQKGFTLRRVNIVLEAQSND